MGNHFRFTAIDWLADEIETELASARTSLEHWTVSQEGSDIDNALASVHQVSGAFFMIELPVASALSQTVEQAFTLLRDNNVPAYQQKAPDCIMQSLVVLSQFVSELRLSHQSHNVPVFLVLNELCAISQQPLATGSDLFSVPVSVPAVFEKKPKKPTTAEAFYEGAMKLHQLYNVAVVSVIRENNLQDNLTYLQKILLRLHKLSVGLPMQMAWEVALALVESLQDKGIPLTLPVKGLLRQVNDQLKSVVTHKSLETYPNTALMNNMLFYVTQSSSQGRLVTHIRQAFALNSGSTSDQTSSKDAWKSMPDAETIDSVVTALGDEIQIIKFNMDECLLNHDSALLKTVQPVAERMVDTLKVLGANDLTLQMQEQCRGIHDLIESDTLDESVLRRIAGEVIDIEGRLKGLLVGKLLDRNDRDEQNRQQLFEATNVVLTESRNNLEQSKEGVIDYISGQWNHDALTDVPNTLACVSGALEMVGCHRAQRVVMRCSDYIDQVLRDTHHEPEWEQLDALADAMAGIEYYLESISSQVNDQQQWLSANELDAHELLSPAEHSCSCFLPQEEDENTTEAIPSDSPKTAGMADDEPSLEEPLEVTESESSVAPNTPSEAELSGMDEDILEIFYEEVDEVLETIHSLLPQWRANFSDTVPLTDIRRAFHTLKGSGRMVTANTVGEFAWSIESLHNRLLDGTVSSHSAHWRITEMATSLVPTLLRAFKGECQPPAERLLQGIQDAAKAMESPSCSETEGLALLEALTKSDTPSEVEAPIEAQKEPSEVLSEASVEETPEADTKTVELLPQATLDNDTSDDDVNEIERVDNDGDEKPDSIPADASSITETAIEPVAVESSESLSTVTSTPEPVDAPEMVVDTPEVVVDTSEVVVDTSEVLKVPVATLDQSNVGHSAEQGSEATSPNVSDNSLNDLGNKAEDRKTQPRLEPDAPEQATQTSEVSDGFFSSGASPEKNAGVESEALVASSELEEDPALQVTQTEIEHPNVSEEVSARKKEDSARKTLLDIFCLESVTHLSVLTHFTDALKASSNGKNASEDLYRALHTLKGSAHMADVALIAELVTPVERWIKIQQTRNHLIPTRQAELLETLTQLMTGVLDLVKATPDFETAENYPILQEQSHAFLATLDSRLQEDASESASSDMSDTTEDRAQALIRCLNTDVNALLDYDEYFSAVNGGPESAIRLEALSQELSLLSQAAPQDCFASLHTLSRLMQSIYDALLPENSPLSERLSPEDIQCLERSHEALLHMIDAVAASTQVPHLSSDLHQALAVLFDKVHTLSVDDTHSSSDKHLSNNHDANASSSTPSSQQVLQPESPSEKPEESTEDRFSNAHDTVEIEEEIIEIFLEESEELLDDLELHLSSWQKGNATDASFDQVLRVLHTFKGGARLAGLMVLGKLTHEFETLLMREGKDAYTKPDVVRETTAFLEHLFSDVDKIRAAIAAEDLQQLMPFVAGDGGHASLILSADDDSSEGEQNIPTSVEAEAPEAVSAEVTPAPESEKPPVAEETLSKADAKVVPFSRAQDSSNARDRAQSPIQAAFKNSSPPKKGKKRSKKTGQRLDIKALPPSSPLASVKQVKKHGTQESVKIAADLLDSMVNLSGESSIIRSRIEEQVSELSYSIEEVEVTIERLQEQLRRLDIETEAQVLFRQEQMQAQDDFDPLEMDRYSHLQQLSRSLVESASDLMDLKSTLLDKTRDTETLLIQQYRVNNDLQESLMRSRMVPFSQLVPRLRRMVRQISKELDKDVKLELGNVEGFLDRTLMERIVAPLEHMLRNAVDHGIESKSERARQGKTAHGTIRFSLKRDASEVILSLKDDGCGINVKKVREIAIEKGLMAENASLSDQQIIAFIMKAGFSTADNVTQISGRGVGMDVVNSEIKQLGGSVTVHSETGVGSEFTVRLPFTLSVNRALMVKVGEESFAVPLNSIEGIVRISPFELEQYYSSQQDARFPYAGTTYQVVYMGALVHRQRPPIFDHQTQPLPVLLIRSHEHAFAIQVDQLFGSREVVVKSLGPQFQQVDGFSGASIMGDGSVVVILDVFSLIRRWLFTSPSLKETLSTSQSDSEALAEKAQEHRVRLIMVVDDSVTVRKVTGRFLEREGFDVMTAKDGIEAIAQLQERTPDLMLLDIEMPRMDGFEVAKQVKNTPDLAHIPIIMITSRTGSKHRERAFGLGVNDYMGKPYQEKDLLASIQHLLGSTQKVSL